MAQNWTTDVYALGHTGSTDLQNMENNFAVLKSLFSGISAPSNNVAGQPWFDETNKILKIRNQANSGWLGVMYGDSSTKIWMYSNVAGDGWVIDSTLTDVVLAIKGGSQAYNANGGTTGGTWTQPNHQLVASEIPDHAHSGTVNSGGTHNHTTTSILTHDFAGGTPGWRDGDSGSGVVTSSSNGAHTHTFTTNTDGGGDGNHNHGTTYRPAAAIGTLQYPKLS
jgi:hypothetical protein